MAISAFDLFSIGIGPSSSHTVGPMRAAKMFATDLEESERLAETASIQVTLYGSLSATGKGHGTDKAIFGGLSGETPETVDPDELFKLADRVADEHSLLVLGKHQIEFLPEKHLEFSKETLDFHSNGLRIAARNAAGEELLCKTYFSVGGGFVIRADDAGDSSHTTDAELPYPFTTGVELIELCEKHKLSISSLMLENEKAWRTEADVRSGLWEHLGSDAGLRRTWLPQRRRLAGGLESKNAVRPPSTRSYRKKRRTQPASRTQ